MLYNDIIINDAGFGTYSLTKQDFLPRMFPEKTKPSLIYNEDLRSIVFVSEYELWSQEELEILNMYGEAFTRLHDYSRLLRLRANYLYIGQYSDWGESENVFSRIYILKRASWREAMYFTTFQDLTNYMDDLLMYGV